jgi:hypothetical protein
MLKIHKSLHLPVPHMTHSTERMQLSPVTSENDELIVAIEQDSQKGEAKWVLEGPQDVGELATFWAGVESDLKKDPDWFDFAED